jgi:hypothetical protein
MKYSGRETKLGTKSGIFSRATLKLFPNICLMRRLRSVLTKHSGVFALSLRRR